MNVLKKIKPVLVLSIICTLICALLIVTYNLTYVDTSGVLTDNLKAIDNTTFSAEELESIYQIVK